ncbi:hypothetical protein [Gimesia sp.]|uniref:hypothetical protein n=1 Tax=Gimesia sp. TaxID=2024833 RepID=UPI003A948BEE
MTNVDEMFPASNEVDRQIRFETNTTLFLHGNQYREEEIKQGRFKVHYLIPPDKEIRMYSNTGVMKEIQAYDGKTLRIFSSTDLTAVIKDGKPIQKSDTDRTNEPPRFSNLVRPHTFLFFNSRPHVPLSTFLKGPDSISAYPGVKREIRGKYHVQILDEEEFAGLKCIRLSIQITASDGKLLTRHELWLARERNLIPVRKLTFSSHRSDIISRSDSSIDSWQEIASGVWFPDKSHQEENNIFTIILEKREQLLWRRMYDVPTIELAPQLPKDVFTSLIFSPGALMKDSDSENQKQKK